MGSEGGGGGSTREPRIPIQALPRYREDLVNASEDLVELTDSLRRWDPSRAGGMAMCLHGPPGTGKSQYVHHLGRELGLDVIIRTGSDLVSKWVGDTERNLAEAFAEARTSGTLLLFDEVDTFLRSRDRAERSWEISRVNEFLQQLEGHCGFVACTTNNFGCLDPAAQRRFVLKIEFRQLRPEQAKTMFDEAFAPWLVDDDASLPSDAFAQCTNVTPGDFAVVRRRVRALGLTPSVAELVGWVQAECAGKATPNAIRGFGRGG